MGGDETRVERGRGKTGCGCLLAFLIVLGALTTCYSYSNGYLPIRRFDSATWRQANTMQSDVRVHMIEWLTRSGQLDGVTRAEVLELLGQPDGGSYFRDWDMVYRLGMERGWLSLDSEWLVIRIGADGRVADYQVVRD